MADGDISMIGGSMFREFGGVPRPIAPDEALPFAALDGTGKIAGSQIPDTAIDSIVASQIEAPGSQTTAALSIATKTITRGIDPLVSGSTPSNVTTALRAALSSVDDIEVSPGVLTIAVEGSTTGGLSSPTDQPLQLFTIPSGGLALRGRRGSLLQVQAGAITAPTLLFQLGDGVLPGADYLFENLHLIGRLDAGYSMWGIGNRREASAAAVDRAVFRNLLLENLTVAITSARRNPGASLGENRDKDWLIEHVTVKGGDNRGIELSQSLRPRIYDYKFSDVPTGLHLLGYTEKARIRDLIGTATDSPVRINFGVSDYEVDGFDLGFEGNTGTSYGAIHFHTEPNLVDVVVDRGRWRNGRVGASAMGRSITVHVPDANVRMAWRDQRWYDCEIEGSVRLMPFFNTDRVEVDGWQFHGGSIGGEVVTTGVAGETNIHDLLFVGVHFTSATKHYVRTLRARYIRCTFDGGVEITDTAVDVVMIDCDLPIGQTIVNNGTNSTVTGTTNSTRKPVVEGFTYWDFDSAAVGTLAVPFAPHPDSVLDIDIIQNDTQTLPVIEANVVNGHKAARHLSATVVRYKTETMATPITNGFAILFAWYQDAGVSTDQNIVSGLSNGQPNIRIIGSTGQISARGFAGNTPLTTVSPHPARGQWHVGMFIVNGTESKLYIDSVSPSISAVDQTPTEPFSGLVFGASGSINSPFLDGYLTRPGILDHVPSSSEVSRLMQDMADYVGLALV